jgi:hypothetical protein
VEPVASYREIGGRLGAYVRANNPSTQQTQSFLSDLLADDELLLPMRDLVTRQCFGSLKAFAGSGGGAVQRDACLQDLARSYLPIVVDKIRECLNGMLDQPARETNAQQNTGGTKLRSEITTATPNQQAFQQGNKTASFSPSEDKHSAKAQTSFAHPKATNHQREDSRDGKSNLLWMVLGVGLTIYLASLGWRTIQTSCTYIASKASNLKYVDTAEFRSLILNNEDRCLSNEAFATQYIRGFGGMNGRCLYRSDGSCIYEKDY